MSLQVLELNVGGRLFVTTRATLCRDSNSMLAKMFSEESELPPAYRDSQGRFFIDRDGKYFNTILSYLREQPFDIPTSRSAREALVEEARFFQVQTTGHWLRVFFFWYLFYFLQPNTRKSMCHHSNLRMRHVATFHIMTGATDGQGRFAQCQPTAVLLLNACFVVVQLAGLIECIAFRPTNTAEAACTYVTLDMLATLTYEEAHAKLIAYARDLLGQEIVHSICNAIVKQYFYGMKSDYHKGHTAGLLYTLGYKHDHTTLWRPGSKPAIDVSGIDDHKLLEIVSKHAGLFKHDLALRGFKLEISLDTQSFYCPASGWQMSPL